MHLRLFIFCCLIYSQSVFAQNCLDILKSNPLYSNSNDIVNGRKWVKESGYNGSPLLKETYWPKADILYNGVHFRDIHMNYDIFKEEIIVYYPERGQEKYVVINKDHLSGFSFNDSTLQRNRLFEYTELKGIGGKVIYEKIPTEKVSFFIRPMIEFDATPSQTILGKYTGHSLYYLNAGSGFSSFSSRSQMINLLANHKKEMNKYIRKQKLKINKKHPEDVVAAIKYFDGLN
jgi:hypothetical protein